MINLNLANNLRTQFLSAKPYPHIIIDNFLSEFLLDNVLEEIKNHQDWFHNTTEWVNEHEINKFYYPNHDTTAQEIKNKLPITNLLMEYLNSKEFLIFLQSLTGIDNLFRDPYLIGGGIHKIKKGGSLSIHEDYNLQPGTKKHRRLNLLLYLNKNWVTEYGGNLELWNKETWKKEVEIEPIYNRAVIFDIDNALHGHPTPLNCPDNLERLSLALYYFTDNSPENPHMVIFYKNQELGIEVIFKF